MQLVNTVLIVLNQVKERHVYVQVLVTTQIQTFTSLVTSHAKKRKYAKLKSCSPQSLVLVHHCQPIHICFSLVVCKKGISSGFKDSCSSIILKFAKLLQGFAVQMLENIFLHLPTTDSMVYARKYLPNSLNHGAVSLSDN